MADEIRSTPVDLSSVRRFPVECTEEIERRHELRPCEKPAVAVRIDPNDGHPYAVCASHVRGVMVPLSALLAGSAGDRGEPEQSVLQGGVVVPRETLATLLKYAEHGAWAAENSREKYRAIDAVTDLLAGTPDIQGNDRKPEPRSPEFKYQAESLNAISFGTPEQDGQK